MYVSVPISNLALKSCALLKNERYFGTLFQTQQRDNDSDSVTAAQFKSIAVEARSKLATYSKCIPTHS